MALKRRQNAAKDVNLDAMVSSGPQGAYEALQLYRSRAIRLRTKNDLAGAMVVVVQGAKCLLTSSYENAGAELASLLLDIFNESARDLDPELRRHINEVDQAFAPASPHRVEFLKGCVKWSIKYGIRELGDPLLHLTLGKCLWDLNDKSATYHFAAGEAPEQLSQKIDDTL